MIIFNFESLMLVINLLNFWLYVKKEEGKRIYLLDFNDTLSKETIAQFF